MRKGRTPKRFKDALSQTWVLVASYAALKPYRVFQPGEDAATSTKFKAHTYREAKKAFGEVKHLPEYMWIVP